jgi:tetratricopeptide (TPR) repeat protein
MVQNPVYTKCPKCEAKHSYTDMISEKTDGAEFWSDGFCMAPIRKDIIKFARCPACNTFFWLKENSIQEPADLLEIKNLENSWSLDNMSRKEIDFLRDVFRSGLADTPEKEIILRIKLWHVINHIIRKYDAQGFFTMIKQKFFESQEFKDSQKLYNSIFPKKLNNLIRLSNLMKLDKNENANYLLFAEIYRELGDFKKAMIFCYKAETSNLVDSNRIMLLKQHITNKSKMAYKL